MAENSHGDGADGVSESEEKRTVNNIFSDRCQCTYTKCYCEENIWKLCEYIKENKPDILDTCFVVFISNKERKIPLWMQSSSKREDKLVIWDYHVIFLHTDPDSTTWVYDLDSELSFPCEFVEYAIKGIRDDRRMKPEFQRKFRVIGAEEYLQSFASDRSHMLSEEGNWLMPPPAYACIHTTNSFNNIQYFISMDSEEGFGEVMDSSSFITMFSSPHFAST